MLVVKQPSLSPERELNRFGIGQDFVIPDHAALARQDIRGKVRVDLIRIGVLGQVLFNTEIKAPELVPVRFVDLVGDGLRQRDRFGIGVQFLEVGNLALLQIHFQAHRDGGMRRMLCGLWEAAKPHTLALANRARTNAGFDAITPASEVASFKAQPAAGTFGWGQHQFHKILRDKRWE